MSNQNIGIKGSFVSCRKCKTLVLVIYGVQNFYWSRFKGVYGRFAGGIGKKGNLKSPAVQWRSRANDPLSEHTNSIRAHWRERKNTPLHLRPWPIKQIDKKKVSTFWMMEWKNSFTRKKRLDGWSRYNLPNFLFGYYCSNFDEKISRIQVRSFIQSVP